jgi:diaminopimelate decarboxylase
MNNVLPDTARVEGGRLSIGGVDLVELAERVGTPAIVLDRATFESRAKAFSSVVEPDRVFYACKALCCVAVCEMVDALGLSLDVCTGGEMRTALAAGVSPDRLLFHGNNKSEAELEAARDAGLARIVVDSFDEIDRLERLRVDTRFLLRVTPGVEAHTHEFIQTGQEDSKFGFTLAEDHALEGLRRVHALSHGELTGVHAHIGSQIFEMAAYDLAVRRLAELLRKARDSFGFEAREINLGGGLGIAYTEDELTPDPADSVGRIATAVEREFAALDLSVPELLIEPGRSLIGSAGVTLYRVGTVKVIPGVRTYVSVDGGMSDNIRPALYGARYEAFLPDRMDAPAGPRVTIAGKHCESGDVLIRDVRLPGDVSAGDLVCVPATGAYTYSMANTYNRVPRPPVVLVEDGKATTIVARETNEDLLRLDKRLDGTSLT